MNLEEDEQQWCRCEWGHLRPFLEMAEEAQEESEDEPLEAPGQEKETVDDNQIVAIEDSQEAVEPDGSQIQVARLANGSVRDMLPEEVEIRNWAEAIEAEAAEEERQREQKRWGELSSSSYTSWAQWSLANQDEGPDVKRARVQIRIQGEGGRVVRDEHYMVALRDGEQLAYQVSVRSPLMEPEDKGIYVQQAEEHVVSTAARGSGQSSAPGPEASGVADEGDETGCQDKDHIDVEEFVASPLGKKFYEEWKAGRAGPQIIGRRFGYGVLGAYASMWESEKEEKEQAERCGEADGGGPSEDVAVAPADDREGDVRPLPEPPGQGQAGFRLNPPPAVPFQIGDSQSSEPSPESDLGAMEELPHHGAASVPAAEEAASSSTRGASKTGTSGTESSSRTVQTDLTQWLL